ncbi:MAG: MCP four helix bundle domain-containing protein, partial [Gammaproteobacteria bacterium]|nr:MCP four helix bundle domain-containing protein [Gammaproteobacteria bacterium]MBU1481377.1 MCP four helix bundle domain-containing protein [Gammaproteobacteria bacterium]
MLKNLTVKSRLIFVLGFLSILAIIIGFLGLRGMSISNEGLRTVYEDRLVPSGQLGEVNIFTAENLRQVHLMLMHDPRLPESKLHDHPLSFHTDQMAENTKTNNKLIDEYAATYLTPEEKQLFEDYLVKRKVYQEKRKKTMNLIEDGKFAEANASMVKETGPAFIANRDAVRKLLELQITVGKEEYEKAEKAYDVTRNISISAIVVSLLLAAFIGYMLIRAIMRPLAEAQEVAGKIAAGDLTSNIEVTSHDEMGNLLTSFKAMQSSIQGLITEIKTSTDTINTASKEIAAGNSDLSQRTEEQASSLEETASSMEELTSTVKQNTENAKQANQLAI